MRTLLSFKLKTMKFVNSISGVLKEVIGDSLDKLVEISTSSLSFNINKVEQAGFSISAKTMFLSQEVKEDHKKIAGVHSGLI